VREVVSKASHKTDEVQCRLFHLSINVAAIYMELLTRFIPAVMDCLQSTNIHCS